MNRDSFFGTNVDHLTAYRTAQQISNEELERIGPQVLEAVALGDMSKLQELLSAEIDVNAKFYQRTMLHEACSNVQLEIVQFLINKGAYLNATDNDRNTPLHKTCSQENGLAIAKFLIDQGADINIQNLEKNTPLHIAARVENLDIIKLLIEKGADLTLKNKLGRTPAYNAFSEDVRKFIEALYNERIHTLELLLRDRLDVNSIELNLSGLGLTNLHTNVSNLKYLCRVVLTNNRLTRFPIVLLSLTELRHLDLSNNDIPSIPDEIGELAELITLYLSYNPIETVPDSITQLLNLHMLRLRRTDIKILPVLTPMVKLFLLDINETPLYENHVPKEVRILGGKALISFLADLNNEQPAKFYNTKLLIVGNQGVGKTSIAKGIQIFSGGIIKFSSDATLFNRHWKVRYYRIIGNDFILYDNNHKYEMDEQRWKRSIRGAELICDWNKEIERVRMGKEQSRMLLHPLTIIFHTGAEIKVVKLACTSNSERKKLVKLISHHSRNHATSGINVERWSMNVSNRTMDIAIWDFAGQEDFYLGHSFFMYDRSIFIVALRLDKLDDPESIRIFRGWLRTLHLHVSLRQSCLFIVGTYLDNVNRADAPHRRQLIMNMVKESGLWDGSLLGDNNIFIEEINTLQDHAMRGLREKIIQKSYELGPSHVPQIYLNLINYLKQQAEQIRKDEPPIESITSIGEGLFGNDSVENIRLLKRALRLLTEWGIFFNFPQNAELADSVILLPEWLTQDILGEFLKPTTLPLVSGGIIHHQAIYNIYKNYNRRYLPKIYAILQVFGLVLPIPNNLTVDERVLNDEMLAPPGGEVTATENESDDASSNDSGSIHSDTSSRTSNDANWDPLFFNKCSIVPFLLPATPPEVDFSTQAREKFYHKRFLFGDPINTFPTRLFVSLSPYLSNGHLWAYGCIIVVPNSNTRCKIEISKSLKEVDVFVETDDDSGAAFIFQIVNKRVYDIISNIPGLKKKEVVFCPVCGSGGGEIQCVRPSQESSIEETRDTLYRTYRCFIEETEFRILRDILVTCNSNGTSDSVASVASAASVASGNSTAAESVSSLETVSTSN